MRINIRTHWTIFIAILFVFIGTIAFGTKPNAAERTENEVRYNAKNEVTNGTYAEPERDGYTFLGWASTKDKADAGIVDMENDKPNDLTNETLSKIGGGHGEDVCGMEESPFDDIKDIVDLYGLVSCTSFSVDEIKTIAEGSNRTIGDFRVFLHEKGKISHAYEKLIGVNQKPDFEIVYATISDVSEAVRNNETELEWDPVSKNWVVGISSAADWDSDPVD